MGGLGKYSGDWDPTLDLFKLHPRLEGHPEDQVQALHVNRSNTKRLHRFGLRDGGRDGCGRMGSSMQRAPVAYSHMVDGGMRLRDREERPPLLQRSASTAELA